MGYDILATHAGQVLVANPYKTKLIAEARIKNDRLDALTLARLLAARFICEVWVPATDVQQRRSLATYLIFLARLLNRVKNRIHSVLARHDLRCPESSLFTTAGRAWLQTLTLTTTETLELRHLLAQLDLCSAQQAETESFIAQLAAQDHRVPRLMQVTGIGRDHLPAETSADFVRQCLKAIDLPDLAVGLITNPKGKLIIHEPEKILDKTEVAFPVA